MVFLYNPWIPRGDDKMGHYVHYIGGGIVDSKIYETGNAAKSFKSPMKELNEQTVLIENAKTNKNDSYHQHTKYDDQVDRYYSTYDIGTLLHNNESYLEGTIDSKYDVDYYSFSYPQKSFYSKMGISSEITISLESKNSQAWTAEMLMQAIETNSCYIVINKIIERVSVEALDFMDRKDIITIFPTQKRNNTTVVVMKTQKTETSNRKVYIPSHVGKCLKELKAEQDHTKEILGNEYKDYNLVLAMTFGMPIGASHVRTKMKQIIKKEGLPDVVFHSLRHTSVTYKLKLSGGDIKAVQGDYGHAQADMVTEVYGHILDEDRKKNAQLMENAFYNKENLNPDIHGASGIQNNNNNNMISVPEGVDADMLMKVLGNPEMAALLTSLAKSIKG